MRAIKLEMKGFRGFKETTIEFSENQTTCFKLIEKEEKGIE